MKTTKVKPSKQKSSFVSKQEKDVLFPSVGDTMGSAFYVSEQRTFHADTFYNVEAVNKSRMTIRLKEDEEIKEGAFIIFNHPDGFTGIIFRKDIENNSFPTAYTLKLL